MQRSLKLVATALIAVLASATGMTIVKAESDAPALRVSITNLTRGQVLSPPVVIVHDGSYRLFSPGEPASPELAALAEDAASDGLLAAASVTPGVLEATLAGGVVAPGATVSIELAADGRARAISVAGMLVTTNDAFFSAELSGLRRRSGASAYATAWDAGSEANTEQCAHIPGPPCGNGGVRVTDGAEGYVFVHAGIHGDADLEAGQRDWRNPVALVTVEASR